MKQCEWEDPTGRCDRPAVLIWKWEKMDEHLCARHYDWYASLYLANAEEYPDLRETVRRNGLTK